MEEGGGKRGRACDAVVLSFVICFCAQCMVCAFLPEVVSKFKTLKSRPVIISLGLNLEKVSRKSRPCSSFQEVRLFSPSVCGHASVIARVDQFREECLAFVQHARTHVLHPK